MAASVDKIMDLIKDNDFVEKIKSFDSIDDVQKFFAEKGADLPIDDIKKFLTNLKDNGSSEAGGILDKIKDVAGDVLDGAGDAADKAKDVAGDAADKVSHEGHGIFETIKEKVSDVLHHNK